MGEVTQLNRPGADEQERSPRDELRNEFEVVAKRLSDMRWRVYAMRNIASGHFDQIPTESPYFGDAEALWVLLDLMLDEADSVADGFSDLQVSVLDRYTPLATEPDHIPPTAS